MRSIVKIRASSLSDLFDCPKRWHARNILKLRTPSSPAARLGHSIHAGTEAFDSARLAGSPITADEAAGVLVDRLYGTDEDIDWEDVDPRSLEGIGLSLHTQYCQDIAPQMTYTAVELPCRDLTLTDLRLTLTGTIDRVYENQNGELGITDIKTGATAVSADYTVKTGAHVAQMGMYTLLAERTLEQEVTAPAVIVGMQTGKTIKAQRVAMGAINDPKSILVGDEYSDGLLGNAAKIIHSGAFYGNPRSMLCSAKFCPAFSSCKYKGD
ncbi:MAG: PD-(D/E)XK nuclease family protein [Burkholderiaceae bacterium]|nr:PD-(D/E)XK nuclease family protein [Burkholderiaceae bacterium]